MPEPRRVLIAADSFKDALPSLEVCQAIERGVLRAAPSVQPQVFPVADGGEGTTEVLAYHLGGKMVEVVVHDPLFRQVKAQYLLSGDGRTAFVEMAQASGLQRLAPAERRVLETTSYGTGELIKDALEKGAEKILLAIGGSATNDAGMGMAAALGWRFFSKDGQEQTPVGKNLLGVDRMESPRFLPKKIKVEVLCDVDNPLYGVAGAAQVYARQKGADEAAIKLLDDGLRHFANRLESHFGKDFSYVAGAGAAGGLGAGAMAFLNARLRPGAQAILELTGLQNHLGQSRLVLTGEGSLDGQTLHGKLVHAIARQAATHGIPAVALCGEVNASASQIEEMKLLAAFSCAQKPQTLAQALRASAQNLELLAFNVMRTFDAFW